MALCATSADGFYHLGSSMGDPREFRPPLLMRAWDELTARLLAGSVRFQYTSPSLSI